MSAGGSGRRDRLVEAMTRVAARHGYGGASVARVVKEAAVSRATFYQHFADREACFLVAYRRVVERIGERVDGPGLPGGGRPTLDALLGDAGCDPAAARIVLVEALGGPAAVREEHRRLLDRAEGAVAGLLDSGRGRGGPIEIPARALLGGLAGVVAIRVFRGEAADLGDLADDLAAWIESYRLPAGRERVGEAGWSELGAGIRGAEPDSLGDGVLGRSLPRGRGALPPSVVSGERRERILAAVARLARERGYERTTVSGIVATAGVTREAFYTLFRGKNDAFLATQAFGLEKSVALTAGHFFGGEAWPDRVWDGLHTLLSFVAGQSDLVFVDLVESYAAGPAAIRRSFENRMAYTLFLEEGYGQGAGVPAPPRIASEAISGAINELMRREVVEGRTETMLEMLPRVVYVTLAPFVGPGAALELIERRSGMSIPRSPAPRGAG